jgi:hypothetical protein
MKEKSVVNPVIDYSNSALLHQNTGSTKHSFIGRPAIPRSLATLNIKLPFPRDAFNS